MISQRKKKRSAHILDAGDADGMVERPIDLFEWHWPHIYLMIEDVEQKSFLFKQAVDH